MRWFLPYMMGTIHEWRHERMIQKVSGSQRDLGRPALTYFQWVQELQWRMEARVGEELLRLLFGHEMARLVLHLPFNRFTWVVEPPQSVGDFLQRPTRLHRPLSLGARPTPDGRLPGRRGRREPVLHAGRQARGRRPRVGKGHDQERAVRAPPASRRVGCHLHLDLKA